jgi:hypothetical protein
LKSQGWQPKRFFYWVFMRDPELDSTDIVHAEYESEGISIRVSHPDPTLLSANNTIANFALLFTKDMVPFEQEIYVKVQVNKLAAPIKLSVNTKVQEETLKARGDPRLQFSAVVYIKKKGDSWEAKTAQSLAAIDGTQLMKAKL